MLLKRNIDLLRILYSSSEELTTSMLATSLQVSTRTIKADIKNIKSELVDTFCNIESKPGKGIWLEYDCKGSIYLKALFNESINDIIPDNRNYYIDLLLIDNGDYMKIEDIADKLFVSKGTIINDLNKQQELLSNYNLIIKHKSKSGIKLFGEESNLREFKTTLIMKIIGTYGSNRVKRVQEFITNVDLKFINEIIIEAEDSFQFILTDSSYFNIMISLALLIERHKSQLIQKNNLQQTDFEKKIATFISKRLEDEYSLNLYKTELIYIKMLITSAKFQSKSVYSLDNQELLREIAPEEFDVLKKVISKIDQSYNENFISDNKFICSLFIHINALFLRLSNSIYLDNPLKDKIKLELGYEFEISTYFSKLIKNYFGFELDDNAVCDIALYMAASLQRCEDNNCLKPNIIVICISGMATSQYVEAKLRKIYPDIKIKHSLSLREAIGVKTYSKNDVLISTVPFHRDDVEIIEISPILTDENLKEIDDKLNELSIPGEEASCQLFELIKEETTLMSCDCKTKKEAIQIISARLESTGYVGSGYADEVLAREEISSTEIGNYCAIPHAINSKVKKQVIGVMILNKPILWDKQKVQIIFMIALDENCKISFREVFEYISNLHSNIKLIGEISKVTDYNELTEKIKKNMKE
jgi:lichenan operon transcriptional antiterminator